MFPYQTIKGGLSLAKIIGGVSKTLTIANQIIPIYRQAAPIINNAKTILSTFKNLDDGKPNKKISKKIVTYKKENNVKEINSNYISNTNIPKFFA